MRLVRRWSIVLMLLLGPAAVAATGVPSYDELQLQARANFTGAFNLPDAAFFTNSSPAINGEREVSFSVLLSSPSSAGGLWFGADGMGGVVFTSEVGGIVSDPTVNDLGMVIFQVTWVSQEGLYYYDANTAGSGLETTLPFGSTGWGSPDINASGEVGFRASFSGDYAFVSYDGTATVPVHAAMVDLDPGSLYSFLFTPAFNDAREIAGKVRLGGPGQVGNDRPDELRVFAADGSSRLIAEDQDGDFGSSYVAFDNSVSLTNTGLVAFVASDSAGDRVVVLSDGIADVEIASEADAEISEIEYFGPSANDSGQVAFRARDAGGLRAVWVGDGTTLRRVIGEHDLVPTDLGTARIDQHDSSPVFGGSVAINDHGDVVFSASLTPPDDDQVEWGSGIFVALASGLILADDFETGNTDSWPVSGRRR